jgi:hypothetical protein
MNVRHFAARTIFMKHRRTKSHKCLTLFKTRSHDETFVRFCLALLANVSRCIANVSRCFTNVRCCITNISWPRSHKNLTKISQKYHENLTKISKNYHKNFTKISSCGRAMHLMNLPFNTHGGKSQHGANSWHVHHVVDELTQEVTELPRVREELGKLKVNKMTRN